MGNVYVGIDLGGTNVKAGVVDGFGQLLAHVSVPTGKAGPDLAPGPVIQRMVAAANQAIETSGVHRSAVAGVGVLSPGQASLARGVVIHSANLPLWHNVHLRAKVSAGLGLPAVLENDANAAAFGEWWAGAGQRSSKSKTSGDAWTNRIENLFMFTLGTGVGGGLIYQGKVVRGAFDFATEVGHMVIIPRELGGELCGCGQYGCLERYCSAKYSAARAVHKLSESRTLRRSSSLGRYLEKGQKGTFTSQDIVEHARSGDAFARECWEETCRLLALACINVCHMIDPEMIVIGGGMAGAGRFLLEAVIRHYRGQWWKMTRPTAKIVLARLGNDAGIIGAAGVVREAFDRGALPSVGQ